MHVHNIYKLHTIHYLNNNYGVINNRNYIFANQISSVKFAKLTTYMVLIGEFHVDLNITLVFVGMGVFSIKLTSPIFKVIALVVSHEIQRFKYHDFPHILYARGQTLHI